MKTSFEGLRKSNKALINKIDMANESLKLATMEIDRLNKAIDIKNICINSLKIDNECK